MRTVEQTTVDESEFLDVVQIGYGPVGQTMAGLLGRSGHRVAAFEQHRELYGLARVGGVDHEVMRILQALDVAEEFEAYACPLEGFDVLDAAGEAVLHVGFSEEGESTWHRRYLLFQPDLERLLDRAVRSLPTVEVHQGWRAVGLTEHDDHVEVTVRRRGTAERRTVRARYVIGADGANSFARAASGIEWVDLGFECQTVNIDFRPNDPDLEIPGLPALSQVWDPAHPRLLMRRSGWKHARWEFLLPHGADPDQELDPRRCWDRLAPWVKPEDGEVMRRSLYAFHAQMARCWSRGRVTLVGDAAHVMPPTLGQGVCAGMRDAATLAWKLDLVLRGVAGHHLLETYEKERRPHVEAQMAVAVELARAWTLSDPVIAAARDAAARAGAREGPPPFSGLPDGVLFHRDVHGDKAAPVAPAGELFVQGLVEHAGRAGRFHDVTGQGFVVLALDADPCTVLDIGQQAFLQQIRAKVAQISNAYRPPADVVADLRGTYTRWLQERSVRAVVVRPDYYVFGGARTLDGLPDLVDDLRRRLLPGHVPAGIGATAGPL